MDKEKIIRKFQKNEITEHLIYKLLARFEKNEHNRSILEKMSQDELRHYEIWKNCNNTEVKPCVLRYWFFVIVSWIFGLTFGVKLMEKGENQAQISYKEAASFAPEAVQIEKEEEDHENALISILHEEKLEYMGSMVLGLNDALVEFTGALAGFTFALQNSRVIGMVALIMGVSASLSMAASEYLSTKTENEERNPLKASFYTGIAYLFTVAILVGPFFIFENPFIAMGFTIAAAFLLISAFTFYSSVVKDINFKERFIEMIMLSSGIAVLSFIIGILIKRALNIDI